jgi:acetylornithine/N-succinyldiaminopimelate aminotransferase
MYILTPSLEGYMKISPYDKFFMPTYKRGGEPFVRGAGMYVYDASGKKYLDFGSGIAVLALGHSHPRIVAELKKQGTRILHGSNLYYTEPQIRIAKLLVKHSFGERVFLCNSGTEANEAAIKFARKWATKADPYKFHVLSFSDGFHGRTYGAMSATAQVKFHLGFTPIAPGFHYAEYNDIASTRATLKKHRYAAVIVEPVQGESGIHFASTAFLQFLRSYCTKHKIALIFDEVQCGVGRTGTLWNYEQHGVIPDMMTLAKPLGGGLPLGAVVCRETFATAIQPGDHGTTFGGNPLACALGSVVLEQVVRKRLLAAVRANGGYLTKKLAAMLCEHPDIVEVRGVGLMVGVEMKNDPAPVIAACQRKGLLLIKSGHNTIRFMPPLTVTRKHIDAAVDIFTDVLAAGV